MKKIFLVLSLFSCQIYAQAGAEENPVFSTLSAGIANFESCFYRIFPLSSDSRFARYNQDVSGAVVTSVVRSVLTGCALNGVMTSEQQNTPVFDTCNGYLTLSRAQVATAVVEGAYAGYVYGVREGAHEAVCVAATNISMNAIDTFLERHAPQWLDYPDIVKRNVYVHIIAHKCVKILQRQAVANVVRATVGRGVSVGINFTFVDQ